MFPSYFALGDHVRPIGEPDICSCVVSLRRLSAVNEQRKTTFLEKKLPSYYDVLVGCT